MRFVPLSLLLLVGCNSAPLVFTNNTLETEENVAPVGFAPTAVANGGREEVVVTGAMHGALCNSRVAPTFFRDGLDLTLRLTRNSILPTGVCDDTNRKIDFVATFELLVPGQYSVGIDFNDVVRGEVSSMDLGTVTVLPCDVTCNQ